MQITSTYMAHSDHSNTGFELVVKKRCANFSDKVCLKIMRF